MKNKAKIIIWSASTLLLLYLLFLGGVYIWVVNKWQKKISHEQYKTVVSDIKSTDNLPQKFYEKYALVNGYDENSTTFGIIASLPWSFAANSCACSDVSYGIVFDTYDRWSLGMKLDNDGSPKKCLNFYMEHFDFLNGAIGIYKGSSNKVVGLKKNQNFGKN